MMQGMFRGNGAPASTNATEGAPPSGQQAPGSMDDLMRM